ncbi:hypothetical protein N7537_006917 [Penicillium hordei]|jgi:hypothetical protein|uniref:Uncharacterized protein n=1 Tax=Penicillium hordei TaxID=40994 RepID=A0AAD6E8V9_9EURO|nr:uncharacterized protein N7537_006917 [Penicillium hordei]KAJ5603961.1 hypothetical protein N7537_006917 [Penicillium hordei]
MNWTYKHTNTISTTRSPTGSIASGIDGWNAYGVELRWKSTDLNSAPVTAFVSLTTAVVTPTTITTTQVSEEESPGFSPGAKAGTGVGVGLGAILTILGIGV